MPIFFHERTLTGASTSTAVRLPKAENHLEVMIGVQVTGTVNYDVEFSMDERVSFEGVGETSATWYTLADMAGLTATQYTTISLPISGIRIKINSGAGSVKLNVNQLRKG